MAVHDADLDWALHRAPDRAADHFGDLQRLPPASFRGTDCADLAERYRRVRALETSMAELKERLAGSGEAAAEPASYRSGLPEH